MDLYISNVVTLKSVFVTSIVRYDQVKLLRVRFYYRLEDYTLKLYLVTLWLCFLRRHDLMFQIGEPDFLSCSARPGFGIS